MYLFSYSKRLEVENRLLREELILWEQGESSMIVLG